MSKRNSHISALPQDPGTKMQSGRAAPSKAGKSRKSADSRSISDCEKKNNTGCANACNINHNQRCQNVPYTSGQNSVLQNSAQQTKIYIRLNHAIAKAGFCSRRKADEYIAAGKVKVNGEYVTTPGSKAALTACIEVDGQKLSSPPALLYIVVNKPIHVVCTASDPQGRKTVLDLLPDQFKNSRLYPVGRLDYFSEGLLLLTNDGELTQRLLHPRHHQPKIYEALVRGPAPEFALAQMRKGMSLDENTRLLPVKVKAKIQPDGNTLLVMELRQGINRQIRRMCEKLGLTILRLKRVAHASLRLGNLGPGKCRELAEEEVRELRKAAGVE